MKKLSFVSKVLNSKLIFQRVALFFLAIVLVFGLAEPGVSQALSVESANSVFKTDYKLKPLDSAKLQSTSSLTQQVGGSLELPKVDNPRQHKYEDTRKRTAFTSTYVNNDGTKTMEYSAAQQNYLDSSKTWKKVDNAIDAIQDKAPEATIWQKATGTEPKAPEPKAFKGKAGNSVVEMQSLSSGLTINVGDKTVTMKPVGAKDVKPVKSDEHSVIYKDAWPNVDIEYELRGESVKEVIILKNKKAKADFSFKVTGGKVIKHPTRDGELTIEGFPAEYSFSALTLSLQDQGVISEQRVTQAPSKASDGIDVTVDSTWLRSQSDSAFPMRIDPSFGRDATAYWMFKSDGYSCGSSNCYANIGALYSGGWKNWRTYFQFPISDLAGKKILNANLHGYFKYGIGGDQNVRSLAMGHANCISYWCQGSQVGYTTAATDFDMNFTAGLQQSVDNSDWGTVWSLWGEEGAYTSYKPYWNLQASIVYDTPTPISTPVSPADKQVIVDTQVNLKTNAVSDADGDAVKYYFRVSTNPDAETGAVINSGWIDAPQWTVPEGILQDGVTYYWHVYTLGATQTNPNWVRSFKVDLRTGKDSTQSYDKVGPVGVDLASGNATLSVGTHTMSALGGNMGLGLNYNTPNRAKKGLKAEYWNVAASYNFANGAPTSAPDRIQRDQNVDFNWGTAAPTGGINADWFYTRWTGQFMAPVAGTYKFGGSNDDNMRVSVNGQQLYDQGCYTGVCYDESKSVTLAAGQVVPIQVDYLDATSLAYAKLYIKGAVAEQILPREWLYTNVTNEPQAYGLTGRYYTDNSNAHDLDAAINDPSRLMFSRQDTNMNLNFGTGSPAQGLQVDNFMARWTGYITAPKAGVYSLGAAADDGVRIKVNTGSWQTVLDRWSYQAGTSWGSNITLPANTPIPIQVDWYEWGGPANIDLVIQGNGYSAQDIPTSWLTPGANALPSQWKLGVDVDGSVSYERLRTSSSSVILEDSTGSTHEYTYTAGGYKPPVDEDGMLSKNVDNSYTFIDTDGRTYIFDASGKLTSLTSPTDDRQPAALKYTYAGDPSRLVKIEDGTTNTRFATVYYKGINEENNICDKNGTNNPSGFLGLSPSFADAPTGMLCAYKTSDGSITNFYYDNNGNLARIVAPGGQITDYAYDSIGRIISLRDSTAADVIVAGLRAADSTVTTQLTYDTIGRIDSVVAPGATATSNRLTHTLAYSPNQTDMRVSGATEPNGYSKRVLYDSLLRTTSETDLTGKTTQTEWDPVKDLQLSSTDATGLKSTTIYDQLDRSIDSYGPAPAAWFGSDRRPTASYVNQVPHASTGYDEGIPGLGVTMFNNVKLLGTPKLYTTSMNNLPYGSFSADLTGSLVTPTDGLSIRATGKIRLDKVGTYTFKLWHGDGGRVYIDNSLIANDWTDGGERFSGTGTYTNDTVGKLVNITIENYKKGTTGSGVNGRLFASLNQLEPGSGKWTEAIGGQFTPAYNLTTSATAYDSQVGNVTSTTQYANPAYGTVGSTTLDPTGLNYVSQAAYEAPGTGYLRQTSKTLAGGASTTYQHYSGSDARDNPCTPEVETYHQAGKPKGKVDPTGRTTETIYNESGDVVATRYNSEPWTCTNYDSRGRVMTTVIPPANGKSGRTITNNYAVGGNPLITSTSDASGTIVVESDLLGRAVKYTDARGSVTTNTYDDFGKLTSRASPIGIESYEYDSYDRLTKQKLDGVTFATVYYDQYSRVDHVDYPAGMTLSPAVRDSLGRVSKVTYNASGQTISDQITRSTSGLILSGIENGVNKSYTYDKADRLTGAIIGNNTFTYGYNTPDASCTGLVGNNPNAAKDGNRTSYTLNGQTTSYCYNMADQLIASSDPRFSQVSYDSHGNTTRLGDDTHKTEFTYDIVDRNVGINETTATSSRETAYKRDVTDRIMQRTYKVDGVIKDDSFYGFIGASDSPSFLTDSSGTVTQKYLSLAGGVRVTIKSQSTSAGATTYSLGNMHGDTMATVNADGAPTIVTPTGPFGERLADHTAPANAATGTSNDYLGAHRKASETDYLTQPIQMGARVYIPELGRFLQVDPVEGGTANNYTYVLDPVNQLDLNGKWSISGLIKSVVNVVKAAAKKVTTAVVAAVKTVKEVVVATVMYVKWLSGNTTPVTAKASDYQWKATGVSNVQAFKSRGDGTYAYSGPGSLQIQGTNGSETIGGANAKFNGKITVSGNTWTFKGTASGINDKYNFDIRVNDGLTARNTANALGQLGGGVCFIYTVSACRPTDYDIYVTGTVSVTMSGTF